MTDRAVTDMDEGSKGGRSSALVFGVVAATLTALLIVIGVAGKTRHRMHHSRTPSRPQLAVRRTRIKYPSCDE